MNIKKYEDLIIKLNQELQLWNFDINSNKENLKRIMKIYDFLKNKKYKEALDEINKISQNKEVAKKSSSLKEESFGNVLPSCPSQAYSSEICFDESIDLESKCRDWDIWNFDEENIEAFNSIEMMSAIFLENLKNELWK